MKLGVTVLDERPACQCGDCFRCDLAVHERKAGRLRRVRAVVRRLDERHAAELGRALAPKKGRAA